MFSLNKCCVFEMRVEKNVNNNQYFGNSFVGDEIRITL